VLTREDALARGLRRGGNGGWRRRIVSGFESTTSCFRTYVPHYWALPQFLATTRWSAPHRYIGTFGLAGPPLGPFPLASPARVSRSARQPRLESCPLYAGRHLARHQAPARLLPGHPLAPGFGVVAVLSTRRQGFAYAHLSSPHLTGAPAFSMTLTPGALDPSRSWRFGASPCRATPKGLPSSSVQPRDAQGTRHLPRVLTDRMVFLGGCATGLLLTDPAAPEVRPTRDVDVITEVGSLAEYDRLADASGWPASSRIRVWARRSRPRTITWCGVSGASRRGWRGMVSRNVATECPEATSPLTKIGVQSLEASRDSRRE
jgi:hypothetical protein